MIKLWDLRKSYRQVNAKVEPLPLMKYIRNKNVCMENCGYIDMITNPQNNRLYASGINNVINCFSLDSTEKGICYLYLFFYICLFHHFSGCRKTVLNYKYNIINAM